MNQLRAAIGLEDDSPMAPTLERILKEEDGTRAGKEISISVSKHFWKPMLDGRKNVLDSP